MDTDLQKNCFVKVDFGVSNKRRKVYKPWWNNKLSVFWNEMCASEREWLRESNTIIKARKSKLLSVNGSLSIRK